MQNEYGYFNKEPHNFKFKRKFTITSSLFYPIRIHVMRSIGKFSIFHKFRYHCFDIIGCFNMSKMSLENTFSIFNTISCNIIKQLRNGPSNICFQTSFLKCNGRTLKFRGLIISRPGPKFKCFTRSIDVLKSNIVICKHYHSYF